MSHDKQGVMKTHLMCEQLTVCKKIREGPSSVEKYS